MIARIILILLLAMFSTARAADTPYPNSTVQYSTTPVWLIDPSTGVAINPRGTAATIVAGQVKLAVTGTAVCLTSAALVNGIVVKALASNAGPITVGGASVNAAIDGTGNGYVLQPGEAMSFAVPNASLACINGPAAAGASYAGN